MTNKFGSDMSQICHCADTLLWPNRHGTIFRFWATISHDYKMFCSSKTGKFATWKIFAQWTGENWRQLTTTDDFYIFSLIWLPKWRPHNNPCDDPNDKVTTQVTTLEDLLTTQSTAHEDLLTTQVTAHEDLLTTLHDDTDDLLADTDKQW